MKSPTKYWTKNKTVQAHIHKDLNNLQHNQLIGKIDLYNLQQEGKLYVAPYS